MVQRIVARKTSVPSTEVTELGGCVCVFSAEDRTRILHLLALSYILSTLDIMGGCLFKLRLLEPKNEKLHRNTEMTLYLTPFYPPSAA